MRVEDDQHPGFFAVDHLRAFEIAVKGAGKDGRPEELAALDPRAGPAGLSQPRRLPGQTSSRTSTRG